MDSEGNALDDDLYGIEILTLAAGITRTGRLSRPDASATLVSRVCGSRVTADVRLADGRLADYAHVVEACALGQATAAVIADVAVGRTPEEIEAGARAMAAMLKTGDPPSGKPWSALAALAPVRDIPTRHESVMLPFRALMAAIESARQNDDRAAAKQQAAAATG